MNREVQRPTEGWSTGPNRDRRSHKMGWTGLGQTSVRSASGLRSWTEGRNPPFPTAYYKFFTFLEHKNFAMAAPAVKLMRFVQYDSYDGGSAGLKVIFH